MVSLTKIKMAFARGFHIYFLNNACSSCKGLKDVIVGTVLMVNRNKHYDPKFKLHRSKKVIPVDPNLFEKKHSKEVMIEVFKQEAVPPGRKWSERPLFIRSTNDLFDPYVPYEGDGLYSKLSMQKMRNVSSKAVESTKNLRNSRQIKKYDNDFSMSEFGITAQDIYIRAHTALANKAIDELYELATERAVHLMTMNTNRQTLHWKFIESLEPPKTVQVRVGEMPNKDLFGQVTVRFYTKQILAIYDRFGRLICGSEMVAKDVLEYVVFEKHIVNVYGEWRLHGKIIPDWLPPKDMGPRTYMDYERQDEELEKVCELNSTLVEDDSESGEEKTGL